LLQALCKAVNVTDKTFASKLRLIITDYGFWKKRFTVWIDIHFPFSVCHLSFVIEKNTPTLNQ